MSLAQQNAGGYLTHIDIFDIFEDKKLGDKKSVAISLTFNSSERTLTDEEVKKSTDKIIKAAEKELGAELRK
jgi:phenylalanyl-tRNA synthetase beta chain